MVDRLETKRQQVEAELRRYFGETWRTLAARWQTAIGHAPPVLRELVGRLRELEAATDETNRQLGDFLTTPFEDERAAEKTLNRAVASLERLNEIAQSIRKDLDDLPSAD